MLVKKVEQLLEKIKREDKKINSFIEANPRALEEARALDKKSKKGKLYGKVIGVKSNINVRGLKISCASKTLENYRGSYDATVIEKIKKEDGLIIGMLNMDEFAAGSSGETSAFGPTENPRVPGFVSGGSSSGSAAAVAAGFCDIALGSDTGGSVRNPASHCGVVGVKPSYGLVSRYGLIDLAMSLDQIGILANDIKDAKLLLDVIRGKDERDTTTFDSSFERKKIGRIKVGVLSIAGIDSRIEELIEIRKKELAKKYGWQFVPVEIKHIGLAVETYYPLVYAEFFSATRRFDGRKYGKKIEETAGAEVLRRIFGGGEITKAEYEAQYYEKALQVKELIKQEFEKVFEKVDCIICPTVPTLPWKIGAGGKMKVEEIYATDALTSPANLAEVCAVSIPAGLVEGFPVGMQVICAKDEDLRMMEIAGMVEDLAK